MLALGFRRVEVLPTWSRLTRYRLQRTARLDKMCRPATKVPAQKVGMAVWSTCYLLAFGANKPPGRFYSGRLALTHHLINPHSRLLLVGSDSKCALVTAVRYEAGGDGGGFWPV